MRPNRIKQVLRAGGTAFGIYCRTPTPTAVELIGSAGFDFVRIDTHHAFPNLETIENMIRAAETVGISPFVRVPNEPELILAVLDMGAHGLVIPHVRSVDEARRVVEAARYAPLGRRGFYTAGRPARYGAVSGREFLDWSREEVMIGVQLEDREAYDSLEAIIGLDGIDIIQCGRGDLSQSLGVPGQDTHPEVLAYEARLVETATRLGKPVSLNYYPTSPSNVHAIKNWMAKGVRIFSLGSDTVVFLRLMQEILGDLRSSVPASA